MPHAQLTRVASIVRDADEVWIGSVTDAGPLGADELKLVYLRVVTYAVEVLVV
jgi:hypothetical protein